MKERLGNKKVVLGGLTMLLILAIIVVSSFFPFILDPSRLGTNEFITEQLIIMAITIASTVSMMFISQASNAQNPQSELAKAKVAFKNSIEKIETHTVFYQWVKRKLQPMDRKDIAEKGMLKIGVDFKVWDLSENEIKSLTIAQKYGDNFFKPLTKKQINEILELKKEVKKLKFVAPNYYTSYKSLMADKNLSEIASSESEKKVLTVVFQLTLKILITFIGAAILASLVRDMSQEGGSSAQAWMRFLSQMFAFVTSSFLGYMLGCKLNDLDAFYIMKRVDVHRMFLEDKMFVPIDEAKEEFKKRCLKEEHALIEHKGVINL